MKKKQLIIILSIACICLSCLLVSDFRLDYFIAEIIYNTENDVDGKIIFSKKSGFYEEDFELKIFAPSEEIYYTLDGSEPTRYSHKYEKPLLITDATQNENTNSMREDFSGYFLKSNPMYEVPDYPVDKCTVLKVAYFDKHGKRSKIEEKVFFVGFQEKFGYDNVNIITVTAEPDDLFDYEKGIYVLGKVFEEYDEKVNRKDYQEYSWDGNYRKSGIEWEREASIQIFDTDRNHVLSQNVGLRIQGGVSRSFYPKSLNIYARTEYGSNQMAYDFFGTGYYPQRVTISCGGNDYYGKMRDRIGAELTEDYSFSTMTYIPYAVFLNGEYWGFYYMTEKYDENYIEHYYGVDKDNVVIIKQKSLETGTPEDYELYEELLEFVENADMSLSENYVKTCELLDIESFLDYFAAEIYMARNGDWPNANFALWRSSKVSQKPYEDGKWRWMLFDVNTSALHSNLAEHDTLAYVIEKCKMFENLSKNREFRTAFAEKLREI